MKNQSMRLAALLVLGLCLAGLAEAQVPLAKSRVITVGGKQYLLTSRLKSILMGDFYYNYNHSVATPMLDSTLRQLGRAEGWTVDISKNGTEITAAKLANYQVFFANYISSWASATGFPTANRTAIQNFVETQGGGVFIMHSSGDSRSTSNWPWYYNVAHPVTYTGESSRVGVSAKVGIPTAAKVHPVMEGIGFGTGGTSDSVTFTEGEWHWFTRLITVPVPAADIFLRMNPATCKLNNAGSNCGVATGTYNYGTAATGYPASWTFPAAKGRIGYFMEAHDAVTKNSMGTANWDRFFKQFMYWMAGYDTVEVVSVGRPGQSVLAMDASGISFHPRDPGVFIGKPGAHSVALYELSGRLIQELRGRKATDYNLTQYLKGAKHGVYVVRVSVAGRIQSRRYIL